MHIEVNGTEFEYNVLGESYFPQEEVLSEKENDLTIKSPWYNDGYSIHSLFSEEEFTYFHEKIFDLIKSRLKKSSHQLPINFQLLDYHKLDRVDELHLVVIKNCIELGEKHFPFPFKKIEKRISEILDIEVECRKPMNDERVFHFRIIRPNQPDYNPLHKDVWLDELREAVTIYVPICGSNELSSLLIAKGSHLVSEDNFIRTNLGASMNGVKFNVPGLIESKAPLDIVRPNPKRNQVLVFSPYLIHGGAMNLNADMTRISLEMRFWRKR